MDMDGFRSGDSINLMVFFSLCVFEWPKSGPGD